MSVDATIWAWSANVKKSTERLVLLSLADRADEDCLCFPSMQRVSNDTLLDIKTVKKVISDLIEKGLIFDTGERKGSTQRVRVLKLIGVSKREDKLDQKRNEPKNGMIPNLPTNEPKNGTLNEPKIGSQNLSSNLTKEPFLDEKEKIEALTSYQPKNGQFKITFDWRPSDNFKTRCQMAGKDHSKFHLDILLGFINYNEAKEIYRSQKEWEVLLLTYFSKELAKPTINYQQKVFSKPEEPRMNIPQYIPPPKTEKKEQRQKTNSLSDLF